MHLISSGLGCDSPSGLELQTFLGAWLQPLPVVLEVGLILEPLGSLPDGPLAAGLSKSPTLCSWVQSACLLPPPTVAGGSLWQSLATLGMATGLEEPRRSESARLGAPRGLEKHVYGSLVLLFHIIFFALKGNGISLLPSQPLPHP